MPGPIHHTIIHVTTIKDLVLRFTSSSSKGWFPLLSHRCGLFVCLRFRHPRTSTIYYNTYVLFVTVTLLIGSSFLHAVGYQSIFHISMQNQRVIKPCRIQHWIYYYYFSVYIYLYMYIYIYSIHPSLVANQRYQYCSPAVVEQVVICCTVYSIQTARHYPRAKVKKKHVGLKLDHILSPYISNTNQVTHHQSFSMNTTSKHVP